MMRTPEAGISPEKRGSPARRFERKKRGRILPRSKVERLFFRVTH